MKEHQIPIQLSNYAHFIVGSSRDVLKINTNPTDITISEPSKSFINSSLDLNDHNEQFLASLYLKDIEHIFPNNSNLNLNIYITLPQINNLELNKFTPLKNKIIIKKQTDNINFPNLRPINFIQSNEFCPINLKEETDFYYGYFLHKLTHNERKLFLDFPNLRITENKIGGFNPFVDISLYEKANFDFSEPIIPLLSINNNLIFQNKKISLIFFAKENFLDNQKNQEILSFVSVV